MPAEINENGELVEMDDFNNQIVSITPFQSEVIGADDTHVFIKELVIENEDICFPCCLKVPRHEFTRIINIWIDTKAEYCTRFKDFCGEFGHFYAIEYNQQEEVNMFLYIEEGQPVYDYVPLIEVTRFDDICDMEHG